MNMKSGKSTSVHHAGWAGSPLARLAMDTAVGCGRSESITSHMNVGQSTSVHRSTRAAERLERSITEARGPYTRSKSTNFYQPSANTLRRARTWQTVVWHGPWKPRLAHHEAGHIVLMKLLGLSAGLRAEIGQDCGAAHWPPGTFDSLPEPQPDPSGIWAATAASVHHAGLMAELLHSGSPWRGPVFYPDQTDYLRADDMLQATFGRHASGAHAFAQTVALNVLNDRWDRVQEIAAHLVEHGQWQFAPAGSTNQISKD